jgi:hypothetical protein
VRYGFAAATFLLTSTLGALAVDPWFGNVYEFESKIAYNYLHNHHHHANVALFNLGFVADPAWATELECQVGHPVIKAQVRHLWLNDCAGDAVSLTGGVSVAGVTHRALSQSLFLYHSHFETEAHVSMGKEFGFHNLGFFRVWGTVLGGIGASTSPWGKALLSLSAIYKENHKFACTLEEGKGFGDGRAWHPFAHTKYNYTDLSLRYQFSQVGYGSIFASVKRRLIAHHCPKRVTTLELGVDIPFSIL